MWWYGAAVLASEAMKNLQSGAESKGRIKSSEAAAASISDQADLVLDNAKTRLASGTRQAGFERYKSRVTQSNAVAEMAASGGGVDVQDLARIKAKGDYNSIAALFESQTQASNMRTRAYNMKVNAYTNQVNRADAAEVGAWGNIAQSGFRTWQRGGFKGLSGAMPSTGYGSTWQPVGTY